jgi:hypothetical protein
MLPRYCLIALLLAAACNDTAEGPAQAPAPVPRPAAAAIRARTAAAALERLSRADAFAGPAASVTSDCVDVSLMLAPPKTIAKRCRRVLLTAAKRKAHAEDANAASQFLEAAKTLGATETETADVVDSLATLRRRARAKTAYDDLSLFLASYGPPDERDSTENDHPRPPIVTKWIVYRNEHVRATYVPDARLGDPPPYERWKLVAFQDTGTNAVLRPADVARRLRGRQR